MRVNGTTVPCTEKETFIGLTGRSMRASLLMGRGMDKVHLLFLMAITIMDTGLVENNKERALSTVRRNNN